MNNFNDYKQQNPYQPPTKTAQPAQPPTQPIQTPYQAQPNGFQPQYNQYQPEQDGHCSAARRILCSADLLSACSSETAEKDKTV